MDSQTVILLVAIGYLLMMLAVGAWANTKMKSAKDFLVAGQSLGFFVMAIASFSSIQSGWGMVGSTGTTSAWGIGAVVSVGVVPLGFALAWFLLGGRLRRISRGHEVYSIPDIVRVRYDSRAAHIWMSIAMILGAIGYMTAQIVAAGVITALLLGIPFVTATWIGGLIVAAYTMAGGMLAAVWTDLIQGVVMIGMSITIFVVALSTSGGWGNMLDTLAGESVKFVALEGIQPAVWIVANAILLCFGIIAQPQLIHKFLMLKSAKELKWGATVAGIGYATTTLFSLGVGLAMRSAIIEGRAPEPDVLDDTATSFLSQFTSPVIAGLALVALLAAIMSSASSFITIGASALTRDLVGALRGRPLRSELTANRLASLGVVIASVLIGLYLDQIIYLLGAIGWAAFAAAIFGPIVLGVYWRRGTGIAALISVIVGLALNIVLTILTSQGLWTPPPTFFAGPLVVTVGVLVYVAGSYLTASRGDQARFDDLYPVMPAPAGGQGRIDRIVLAFTLLLTLSMIGMIGGSPGLTMMPVPLMVALLTLLATLRPGNRWPVGKVLLAQGIFHLCSLAIWLVAWLAVGNDDITIAGMTTSMGMLVMIGWPFYTITSGLLYAFCSGYSSAIAEVTAEATDRN